jgi:glutaredoxin-related protein
MLKIYDSALCPDCVKCKEALEQANVPFVYLSITESLLALKQFLKLRETREEFVPVRERGQIGIPCILAEDGKLSFTWDEYLK